MQRIPNERGLTYARRLIACMRLTHVKKSGRYKAALRGPQHRRTRIASRARGHNTQASPK